MEYEKNTVAKKILNCKHIQDYFENPKDLNNPCKEIISIQNKDNIENFLSPESWCGDISQAKILFVLNNPTINKDEKFPEWKESFKKKQEFFENRFIRGLEKEGTIIRIEIKGKEPKSIRSWGYYRNIATKLLNKRNKAEIRDMIKNHEFALIDTIHCKSLNQKGLTDRCIEECIDMHFKDLIQISAAKLIICMGKYPKDAFRRIYKITKSGLYEISGKKRYVIFMIHFNDVEKDEPGKKHDFKTNCEDFGLNYNKIKEFLNI